MSAGGEVIMIDVDRRQAKPKHDIDANYLIVSIWPFRSVSADIHTTLLLSV